MRWMGIVIWRDMVGKEDSKVEEDEIGDSEER